MGSLRPCRARFLGGGGRGTLARRRFPCTLVRRRFPCTLVRRRLPRACRIFAQGLLPRIRGVFVQRCAEGGGVVAFPAAAAAGDGHRPSAHIAEGGKEPLGDAERAHFAQRGARGRRGKVEHLAVSPRVRHQAAVPPRRKGRQPDGRKRKLQPAAERFRRQYRRYLPRAGGKAGRYLFEYAQFFYIVHAPRPLFRAPPRARRVRGILRYSISMRAR